MRIYYFGELIEDTNETNMKNKQLEQTRMELPAQPETKKTGMPSVGDLLKDLDLNIDVYRPLKLQKQIY